MTRISLKDIQLTQVEIAGKIFYLDTQDDWVGRGSNCLVYNAWKEIDEGGKLRNRVILKEFFPILAPKDREYIRRTTDGAVQIAEDENVPAEYALKLARFEKSKDLFTLFRDEKTTNNYFINVQDYLYGNGTYYIVAAYDEAESIESCMEKKNCTLYDFVFRLEKVAATLEKIHQKGYLHLDVTPGNLMYFQDGYVRIMDADTIVSKEELLARGGIMSASAGYGAPEIYLAESDIFFKHRIVNYWGRSDIFSIGAILYHYLYGKKLAFSDCSKLNASIMREELIEHSFLASLKPVLNETDKVYPDSVLRLFARFFMHTITYDMALRYENMGQVRKELQIILSLINDTDIHIIDKYHKNLNTVHGREKKLNEIQEKLQKCGNIRQNRVIFISGIGGIGKSTLAREYATVHEEEYEIITEVTADSARAAIMSIELNQKTLYGCNEREEEYFNIKLEQVKRIVTRLHTLIIVNDYNVPYDANIVEELKIWREMKCDILLTNRNDWKSEIPCVSLATEDLSCEKAGGAAIAIFKDYYLQNAIEENCIRWKEKLEELLQEEHDDVRKLVKLLDYHPLAIKVMAKQMAYVMGEEIRPSEMLAEINSIGVKKQEMVYILNEKDGNCTGAGDAYYHLEKLFEVSSENERLSHLEKEVLRYMILVPPESGICLARFIKWTGLAGEASKVITNLCKKGWIEYNPEGIDYLWENEKNIGVYKMPMIISEILAGRDEMVSTMQNSKTFIGELCQYDTENITIYKEIEELREQALLVGRRVQQEESSEYIDLVNLIVDSDLNTSVEQYKKTIELYESILEVCKRVYGEESREMAFIYSKIGGYYNRLKNWGKAIKYLEKALEIEKKERGVSKLYIIYDRLGESFLGIGNSKKGVKYKKKALYCINRMQRIYAMTSDIVTLYMKIGSFCERIGHKDKGLFYKREALDIDMMMRKNRNILPKLYFIKGQLYYELGKRIKGTSYMEVALLCLKNAKETRSFVSLYSDMGWVYCELGKWEKALECYENALRVSRKLLGEENGIVVSLYINIGDLYIKTGKQEKGSEYKEKASQILKSLN